MPTRTVSSDATSTKQLLLNGLIWMLGLTAMGFLTALVRFETHHGKHTQVGGGKSTNAAVTTGAYSETRSPKEDFMWSPLSADHVQCVSNWLDPFPDSFDAELYQKLHGEDYNHYVKDGRKKGLECTKGQRMKELFNAEILPAFETYIRGLNEEDEKLILEIGPFLNPMVVGGEHVKYFDLMNLEQLRERAAAVGYPEVHPVNITYVDPHGNLGNIPERFLLVVSSNVLPNQLDLIRHLQDVGNLLVDGGYYALTVSARMQTTTNLTRSIQLADKRYMFDYYLPETDIAAVLEDHMSDHRHTGVHRLRSIMEHRALTTHNDISKHWSNAHGTQYTSKLMELLQSSMDEYQRSIETKDYIDVHNYHFTPQNLAFLIDTLFNLELIDLKVHRVYDTLAGTFEFGIVLQKCKAVTANDPKRKQS